MLSFAVPTDLLQRSKSYSDQIEGSLQQASQYQQLLSEGQSRLAAAQNQNIQRQEEALAFTKQLEERIANTVGEVSQLLHAVEPAVRTVSALVTGRFGMAAYAGVAVAGVTMLLLICGFVRYACVAISASGESPLLSKLFNCAFMLILTKNSRGLDPA